MNNNNNNNNNINNINDKNINDKNINNIIKDIYSGNNFYLKYSSDLYLALSFIVIIFFISLYFYFKLNINFYKTNWNIYRCNPLILPFAGYINSPPNESVYEYTYNNYNQCISEYLEANAVSNNSHGDDLDGLAILDSTNINVASSGLSGLQLKNFNMGLGSLNSSEFTNIFSGLPFLSNISDLLSSGLSQIGGFIDYFFMILISLINALYYYIIGFIIFIIIIIGILTFFEVKISEAAADAGFIVFLIALIVVILPLFIFIILSMFMPSILYELADLTYGLSQSTTNLNNKVSQNYSN